jgi:hypothetical protein
MIPVLLAAVCATVLMVWTPAMQCHLPTLMMPSKQLLLFPCFDHQMKPDMWNRPSLSLTEDLAPPPAGWSIMPD